MDLFNITKEMSLPSNIKGSKYIRSAIKFIIENSDISITKELYPKIAKIYNATPSSVERCIRHAIEYIFAIPDIPSYIKNIFGEGFLYDKKPTNSEFLFTVADYIKVNGCN